MSEPKKSQTESNSIFDGHGDGLDRMRQSQLQEVASRRHFVLKWIVPALVVVIAALAALVVRLNRPRRHMMEEPPMAAQLLASPLYPSRRFRKSSSSTCFFCRYSR